MALRWFSKGLRPSPLLPTGLASYPMMAQPHTLHVEGSLWVAAQHPGPIVCHVDDGSLSL